MMPSSASFAAIILLAITALCVHSAPANSTTITPVSPTASESVLAINGTSLDQPSNNSTGSISNSTNSTVGRLGKFLGLDVSLGLAPPYPYPGYLTNPLCYPPYGVGYPLLNCGAPYWG